MSNCPLLDYVFFYALTYQQLILLIPNPLVLPFPIYPNILHLPQTTRPLNSTNQALIRSCNTYLSIKCIISFIQMYYQLPISMYMLQQPALSPSPSTYQSPENSHLIQAEIKISMSTLRSHAPKIHPQALVLLPHPLRPY